MTFDEWLDQPQTVTTRRERLEHCLNMEDDDLKRDMLRNWVRAAWNEAVEETQRQTCEK